MVSSPVVESFKVIKNCLQNIKYDNFFLREKNNAIYKYLL